ncbi:MULTISPECIES: hypothetical protein [Streptomyces]|uniref:hypothetical protein n=1 Tax=Streptomyces TaxID=1883 RepID=UPI00240D753A|nr:MULTISPECIES: hypothetical protein [Streptomyces]WFB84752.1 hypothetical protein MMU79_16270 [Streptomyces olivaceus]WGK49627.1 hypothetical protein M6G09_30725 [Streptomyces sp. B146]
MGGPYGSAVHWTHPPRAQGRRVAAGWCYEAAAPACFDAAVDAWFRSGGADDPVRLFDEAVATLRS